MQFTTLIRKEREATQWGYILALKIHKHYIVQKKSKYPSGNQSIPDVQQLEADQTQSFVSIFQPVSGSNKPCWQASVNALTTLSVHIYSRHIKVL